MKQACKTRQRRKLVLNFSDTVIIAQLHSSIAQRLRLAHSNLMDEANHNVEHIAILDTTTNHRQRHIKDQTKVYWFAG